jgi:hypothetical protein
LQVRKGMYCLPSSSLAIILSMFNFSTSAIILIKALDFL